MRGEKLVISFITGVLLIFNSHVSLSQQSLKASMLDEVNKVRAQGCKCGSKKMAAVAPLKWNDKLQKAAEKHAEDMFRNKHFSHTGTDKSVLDDRINRAGYKWSAIGENIAKGQETVKEVVEGWKNSPSHCAILMDPEFNETGAARQGPYWVIVFAGSLEE